MEESNIAAIRKFSFIYHTCINIHICISSFKSISHNIYNSRVQSLRYYKSIFLLAFKQSAISTIISGLSGCTITPTALSSFLIWSTNYISAPQGPHCELAERLWPSLIMSASEHDNPFSPAVPSYKLTIEQSGLWNARCTTGFLLRTTIFNQLTTVNFVTIFLFSRIIH